MSKRLKRRIKEICELDSLSKDERLQRAHDILNDTPTKQKICNENVGISFKDIERVMRDILSGHSEKPLTHYEEEYEDIMDSNPEKIYPEIEQVKRKSVKTKLSYLLDQDEINVLIAESEKTVYNFPINEEKVYRYSYSQWEVNQLINGNYDGTDKEKK